MLGSISKENSSGSWRIITLSVFLVLSLLLSGGAMAQEDVNQECVQEYQEEYGEEYVEENEEEILNECSSERASSERNTSSSERASSERNTSSSERASSERNTSSEYEECLDRYAEEYGEEYVEENTEEVRSDCGGPEEVGEPVQDNSSSTDCLDRYAEEYGEEYVEENTEEVRDKCGENPEETGNQQEEEDDSEDFVGFIHDTDTGNFYKVARVNDNFIASRTKGKVIVGQSDPVVVIEEIEIVTSFDLPNGAEEKAEELIVENLREKVRNSNGLRERLDQGDVNVEAGDNGISRINDMLPEKLKIDTSTDKSVSVGDGLKERVQNPEESLKERFDFDIKTGPDVGKYTAGPQNNALGPPSEPSDRTMDPAPNMREGDEVVESVAKTVTCTGASMACGAGATYATGNPYVGHAASAGCSAACSAAWEAADGDKQDASMKDATSSACATFVCDAATSKDPTGATGVACEKVVKPACSEAIGDGEQKQDNSEKSEDPKQSRPEKSKETTEDKDKNSGEKQGDSSSEEQKETKDNSNNKDSGDSDSGDSSDSRDSNDSSNENSDDESSSNKDSSSDDESSSNKDSSSDDESSSDDGSSDDSSDTSDEQTNNNQQSNSCGYSTPDGQSRQGNCDTSSGSSSQPADPTNNNCGSKFDKGGEVQSGGSSGSSNFGVGVSCEDQRKMLEDNKKSPDCEGGTNPVAQCRRNSGGGAWGVEADFGIAPSCEGGTNPVAQCRRNYGGGGAVNIVPQWRLLFPPERPGGISDETGQVGEERADEGQMQQEELPERP